MCVTLALKKATIITAKDRVLRTSRTTTTRIVAAENTVEKAKTGPVAADCWNLGVAAQLAHQRSFNRGMGWDGIIECAVHVQRQWQHSNNRPRRSRPGPSCSVSRSSPAVRGPQTPDLKPQSTRVPLWPEVITHHLNCRLWTPRERTPGPHQACGRTGPSKPAQSGLRGPRSGRTATGRQRCGSTCTWPGTHR